MKKSLALLAAVLAAFCFAVLSFAQTPTCAIEGTVTDPTGAVIPNTRVTVTEVATGRTNPLTTNSVGFYSARNLLPGAYNVNVETFGFAVKILKDVARNSGAVFNVS